MSRRSLLLPASVVAAVLAFGHLAPERAPAQPVRPVAPSAAPSVAPEPATLAARAFMDVYAGSPTREAQGTAWQGWGAAVDRLATADLAAGLRQSEPERLPRGRVTAAFLVEHGDDASAVRVVLDTGERFVVTVEPTADARWVVSDVRPQE